MGGWDNGVDVEGAWEGRPPDIEDLVVCDPTRTPVHPNCRFWLLGTTTPPLRLSASARFASFPLPCQCAGWCVRGQSMPIVVTPHHSFVRAQHRRCYDTPLRAETRLFRGALLAAPL